jgi:hypothetical protein
MTPVLAAALLAIVFLGLLVFSTAAGGSRKPEKCCSCRQYDHWPACEEVCERPTRRSCDRCI